MKKATSTLILLFLLYTAYSCSCIFSPMSVKTIIDTDLAFKGEVIGKENLMDQYKYTFRIEELIKGEIQSKKVTIYSSTHGAACGVNYSIGDEYYLYAHQYKGKYSTGLCSQNIQVKSANKAYKKLICHYRKKNKERTWKNLENKITAKGKIQQQKAIGQWVFYHEDGTLASIGSYQNGKKEGDWEHFLDQESSAIFIKKLTASQKAQIANPQNIQVRSENFKNGERLDSKQRFDVPDY